MTPILPFLLASAAEQPPPIPEGARDQTVVVVGSRTGDVADQVVATADRIERLRPVTLRDALEELPGVRATSTGGEAGGTFLSVRGGEPNFTLVTIEGMRVTDTTNSKGGAFDFGLVAPDLVRSVEVERSASSASHGADSLAGVVNVRLREPVSHGLDVGAVAGATAPPGVDASVRASAGWATGGLLAAAAATDTGDLDPDSRLKRGQFVGRLRQEIGPVEIAVVGIRGRTERTAFPEDSGGPEFAVVRQQERGRARLDAVGLSLRHSGAGTFTPSFAAYLSEVGDKAITPAIAPDVLAGVPAIEADSRLRRFEAVAQLQVHAGPVRANAGMSHLEEDGRSVGTILFGRRVPTSFALDRSIESFFGELTLRPRARMELNLAGRHDAGGGASRSTWKAGVSWSAPNLPIGVFARAGTGFKLPSLYALGHPLVGNRDLRPERGRSLEGGMRVGGRTGALSLTLFENRYRDLIDFDPVLFRTVNRSRVRIRGFDVDGRLRLAPSIELHGTLTHLRVASETPLRQRPTWTGSARATWTASDRLELDARLRYDGGRLDSSVPTGLIGLPPRGRLDLGGRLQATARLAVTAALRNATDQRRGDAVGFPDPGRSLRIAAGWSLASHD